jgi:glycosyltransferase involved in cell wall biosynthesis
MKPLISVIMSVYNDSKNIRNSIESILNQDFKNFEFLIMDDGSTDESYEIIDIYSKDTRVKVFKNNENLGLTKSLNILLEACQGSFIARQDSDDLSLASRFTKQLQFINNKNLDFCGSRAIIKGSTKVTPNRSYYLPLKLTLKIKNPFIHGSLLIKKSIMKDVNNYDERFFYSQDFKLVKDIFNSGYSMKIIREPLYVLNLENNISTNYKDKQRYYADCVRKNIIPNE